MLEQKDVFADIAVKNLNAARKFYEDTLGLEPNTESEESISYRSGSSMVNVYHSEYAGTNQATAVTWTVGDDFEKIVKELKSKGVKFEHYDMPGMKREGDVHISGDTKIAWFKDPDGNILSIMN